MRSNSKRPGGAHQRPPVESVQWRPLDFNANAEPVRWLEGYSYRRPVAETEGAL